jgi:Protein of unknown function (DUF2971)
MKVMKNAILNEVFQQAPSATLYHYTNQKGLLGIVKDKQIWATHTQYLNDRQEYSHAAGLVLAEVENLLHSVDLNAPGGRFRQTALEGMVGDLHNYPQGINVCVCSFSEDGDALSQWRAYGRPTGYALGFSGEFLKKAIQPEQWYLAKCIYEEDKQRALAIALVEEVLEERIAGNPANIPGAEFSLPKGGNLLAYLHRYAPVMKHNSFREEREWRIISRPLMVHRKTFEYREGPALLVPYCKLDLCAEGEHMRLDALVVGPSLDVDRTRMSAGGFLLKENVEMPDGKLGLSLHIRDSVVPYRDW